MLRSNSGGLTLCYTLRRLSNNIQEPYPTLSLQAIDASDGGKGNLPTCIRLTGTVVTQPRSSKNLQTIFAPMAFTSLGTPGPMPRTVIQDHLCQTLVRAGPDKVCNHKQAVATWSTEAKAECRCKNWSGYKKAALNPSDPHWVLRGSLLTTLLPPEPAVIAEGSLLKKVFPVKKDYLTMLARGLCKWAKDNGLPSMPKSQTTGLGQLFFGNNTHNTSQT